MGGTPTPAILPDKMPDAWVDQLKNVVTGEKPKLWIILLGSSLIASAITSAVSVFTAVMNIKASERVEQMKAQLELQKEIFRTRETAYSNLEKDLGLLDLKLQSLSSLVEIA